LIDGVPPRGGSGLVRRAGQAAAAFLEAIAVNLEGTAETIVLRAMAETGLPEVRIRGDLGRTTGQLRLFARVVRDGGYLDARIDHALPERTPPRADIRLVHQPLGPVVVFGASNFPLAFSVAGGDTASAFAAGCPVIVKAHHAHPGTSELAGQAIQQAVADCGLPEGTFSLLFGSGTEIGVALVADPRVQGVGFTGSFAGGTALMKVAQQRAQPIPVYAEMSSINPVVLLPGALAERGAAHDGA
jgi:2,5-dioxopentanoate dehydrogenase